MLLTIEMTRKPTIFSVSKKVARAGIEPATHGFSIRDAESEKNAHSCGNLKQRDSLDPVRMRHRMQFGELSESELLALWPVGNA